MIGDRYRLIERIASGGSAEVWRAHDDQLNRPVAVKRLHPHLLPDEASRKRLAAEARAAAGLSHPVIVGIYDVDTEGDAPAIVMELVEGESLAARVVRDGPLEPREAARLAADVAEALYHAHQRGVVHRDVKPGNVLIASDGRTRLVDFGIAHSLAESAERLTLTGTVIGTLSAMAPEQLAGGPITPRTDLYGVGVVLHEALTGRPPFGAASPIAMAGAQKAGPPPLDGVDPGLAAVVAACLAPEPENRPLHAGALASALRAWAAGDPAPAMLMAPTATHARADAPQAVDTAAVTQPSPAVVVGAPRHDEPGGRSGAPARRFLPALAALLLAGVLALAVIGLAGLEPASPADGSPSPTVVTTPAVTPVPATPVPTEVALPPGTEKLAEKYAEECGQALDPGLVAGMNKKAAEEIVESLIDACKEARDDD